jgi:ABC-type sulfate transport system permease component
MHNIYYCYCYSYSYSYSFLILIILLLIILILILILLIKSSVDRDKHYRDYIIILRNAGFATIAYATLLSSGRVSVLTILPDDNVA